MKIFRKRLHLENFMLRKINKLDQKKSVGKFQNKIAIFKKVGSLNFRNSYKYLDIYKNILLQLNCIDLAGKLIKIKKLFNKEEDNNNNGVVVEERRTKFIPLNKVFASPDLSTIERYKFKLKCFAYLSKIKRAVGKKEELELRRRFSSFKRENLIKIKEKKPVKPRKSLLVRKSVKELGTLKRRFTYYFVDYRRRRVEKRIDWELIRSISAVKKKNLIGEYCGNFLFRIFERKAYHDLFDVLNFSRFRYLRAFKHVRHPDFISLKKVMRLIQRRKFKTFRRLNKKLRIFYFTGHPNSSSQVSLKKGRLMRQITKDYKRLKKKKRLAFKKKIRQRKYWFKVIKKSVRRFFRVKNRVSKAAIYSNPVIRDRFVFMFLFKKLLSAYTTFKNEENLITSLRLVSNKLISKTKKHIKKYLRSLSGKKKGKKNRSDIFYNIFVTVHKGDILVNLVLPRLNKLIARFSVSLLKRSKKKRKNKHVVILRLMKYFIYFLNFLNMKKESLKTGTGRAIFFSLIVKKSPRDFKLKFFLKIFLKHVRRFRKKIKRNRFKFRKYMGGKFGRFLQLFKLKYKFYTKVRKLGRRGSIVISIRKNKQFSRKRVFDPNYKPKFNRYDYNRRKNAKFLKYCYEKGLIPKRYRRKRFNKNNNRFKKK